MEADIVFNAVKDPFLAQHRFRDAAILPGVISLEAFAEAANLARPDASFIGFSEIRFDRALTPQADQAQPATIRMTEVTGGVKCELVSPWSNTNGAIAEADRVYASAIVEFGDLPVGERVEIAKPVFGWFPFLYPTDMPIFHGPPFQTFHGVSHCHGGGWGKINVGDPSDLFGEHRSSNSVTPSAAIDGCLVACGFYSFAMIDQKVYLPAGIERYRQFRRLESNEECFVQYTYREKVGEGHIFDFQLVDATGNVVVAVEGYRANIVTQ